MRGLKEFTGTDKDEAIEIWMDEDKVLVSAISLSSYAEVDLLPINARALGKALIEMADEIGAEK